MELDGIFGNRDFQLTFLVIVVFLSRTRSEQASTAVAMRSKWKSELMRKRGKGRGDIFNVQYISNFQCATHIQFSFCNKY